MNDLEIKAGVKSLKNILCDNDLFYQIPDYQRPYSWDKDELSDLIDDLADAHNHNKNEDYFCGSLVLVNNKKDKRFDIIDGQQRITTFIVLSCVFRDFYLDSLKNKARDFIKDSIQDKYDSKKRKLKFLTDENYQNLFEQTVLKKIDVEGKTKKNQYLKNAKALQDFFKNKTDDEEIKNIDEFVEWVFENVVMTRIICPSNDSAIQIFNVLNDRGMPLSSIDILKSTLMQRLSDEDRTTFKNSWDNINKKLEQHDLEIENLFTTYLYYIAQSNPKKSLHKELLEIFKGKNSLEIVYEIDRFADNYIEILISEDKYIYCLRYLKHFVYWQTILTTAKFKNYQNIEHLKEVLVAYYYQNWIGGGTVNRIKQTSFSILKKLDKNIEIDSIKKSIKDNLNKFGTTNEYKRNLESSNVFGQKWDKPLLLLLEYFFKDDSNQSFISRNSKKNWIEHILPQKIEKNSKWQNIFSEQEIEKWTNSLANLTLLSLKKNIQARNYDFQKKKETYTDKDNVATSFEITRRLFEKDKWTVDELEARQKELTDKLNEILDVF